MLFCFLLFIFAGEVLQLWRGCKIFVSYSDTQFCYDKKKRKFYGGERALERFMLTIRAYLHWY